MLPIKPRNIVRYFKNHPELKPLQTLFVRIENNQLVGCCPLTAAIFARRPRYLKASLKMGDYFAEFNKIFGTKFRDKDFWDFIDGIDQNCIGNEKSKNYQLGVQTRKALEGAGHYFK